MTHICEVGVARFASEKVDASIRAQKLPRIASFISRLFQATSTTEKGTPSYLRALPFIRPMPPGINMGMDIDHAGARPIINLDVAQLESVLETLESKRHARAAEHAIVSAAAHSFIRLTERTRLSIAETDREKDIHSWQWASHLALGATGLGGNVRSEVLGAYRQVAAAKDDDYGYDRMDILTSCRAMGIDPPQIKRVPSWYYIGSPQEMPVYEY